MSGKERRGICCAGNWIIDHVKTIDVWPEEETLANIVAEERGTGGAPYNVGIDLARFGVDIPLAAIGLVGDDADGEHILADCQAHGIDTRLLWRAPGVPTSYTDVMTVRGSGRRTFFHNRGANALLAPEHFPAGELSCRILGLGYLLLLDGLDAEDLEYGTRAARVLSRLRAEGIATAVDVVSEASDRFVKVVTPALPHTDYLIVNEIEAGRTTGRTIRAGERLDQGELEAAAADLLGRGVRRLVVIHAPEMSCGLSPAGERILQPGHVLPPGAIRGTAGAGDAFFAGMLAGIHEGWRLEKSLRFATAAAASCLRHPTCTGGVGSAEEIWELSASLPLAG
jgi:sugar/nucleoside kinase (ribokinase family)